MATASDPLFVAVGTALEKWSRIEVQLASLFAILSDIPDEMKAHRVFDTVIGFETRLAIIDTLMSQETLDPLGLETWKRFSAKLKKQYKKRHELAHFGIVNTITNGVPNMRLSPFLTYGTFTRDELRYLTVEEITARGEGFLNLVRAFSWFYLGALKRRGRHLDIPMPDLPLVHHLQALASQILEARASRPRSSPE